MGPNRRRPKRKELGFSEEERSAFEHGTDSADHAPVPGENRLGQPQSPIVHRHFEVEAHGKDVPTLYEEQQKSRFHLDARSRKVLYLGAGLVVIFLLVLVLPNYIFNANNQNLSVAWFTNVLGRNVSNLVALISGGGAIGGIDLTINRLVIVGLAGAALAVAGTAYQGALKNQLACPSTLGVMSGAQFGCVLYIWIAPTATFLSFTSRGTGTLTEINSDFLSGMNIFEQMFSMSQMAVFSLVGSFVVVSLVLVISSIVARHRNPRVAMVIIGQVIAAIIGSFVVIARMWFASYGDDYQMQAITTIMLGNFDNVFTPLALLMVGAPVAICLAIIIALRAKLNVLAFDEAEAQSMGIKTGPLRTLLIACCTILTAVIVAYCGGIGYVGFLIPHLARRVVGPDFRFLLPASALMGAGFLLLAYYLVSIFSIPGGSISMATTAIGVVIFIVVIFHQRRTGRASW